MKRTTLVLQMIVLFLASSPGEAARVKDLAHLEGVQVNHLIGYGVVVGLPGTGDSGGDLASVTLSRMLHGLGISGKQALGESKNIAAVSLEAEIPPFAKRGTRLDVHIASVGSAASLDRGELLLSPLRGPDGQVYALAQGLCRKEEGVPPEGARTPVPQQGAGPAELGLKPTGITAVVTLGAVLEKAVPFDLSSQHELHFVLDSPDFTTAGRLAFAMNRELGTRAVEALDAATVRIPLLVLPQPYVESLSRLENLDLEVDRPAKIVINPHNGMVILGEGVTLLPTLIAHPHFKIEIGSSPLREASARTSAPASSAEPALADPKRVGAQNSKPPESLDPNGSKPSVALNGAPPSFAATLRTVGREPTPTVADLASSLNKLGASPQDLMDILTQLHAAGALTAQLEVAP